MSQYAKKLFIIVPTVALFLAGCSITDRGNDYQLSRSNDNPLIVNGKRSDVTDKLVIPFEDKIPNFKSKHEFVAPEVPQPYIPFADLKITWDDDRMWITSTSNREEIKKSVELFFSALLEKEKEEVFKVSTNNRLETQPVSFVQQSSLAALWSSITRLYPDKVTYEVVLEDNKGEIRIGIRYKTIKTDVNGKVEISKWLAPNTDERIYSIALDLWGNLSTQTQHDTESLAARNQSEPNSLWLAPNGHYAVRLEVGTSLQTFINLVQKSELHMTTKEPLQIAFIPAEEIPKIGDLKKLVLPAIGGGKQVTLGSIRRRNLNDLTWEQRSYPVTLESRVNGVFVTVDASNTEQPKLVSYRIMQKLFNAINSN